MSIRILNRVWEHSGAAGVDLVVLLALADEADDHGWVRRAGQPHLISKSRTSRSTFRRAVERLCALGELRIEHPAQPGRGATVQYRILVGLPEGVHSDPLPPATEKGSEGVQKGSRRGPEGVHGQRSDQHFCPTPKSQVPSPRGDAKRPIPPDFGLTPERHAAAAAVRPGAALSEEFEKFLLWHRGHGVKVADWDAQWLKWVHRIPPPEKPPMAHPPRWSPPDDQPPVYDLAALRQARASIRGEEP